MTNRKEDSFFIFNRDFTTIIHAHIISVVYIVPGRVKYYVKEQNGKDPKGKISSRRQLVGTYTHDYNNI